ncbi:hypothetical protein BH10BAC2_BH10BAC2_11380 [soil metagenome]
MVTYLYKRKKKNGLLLYPKHFDKDFNNERHQFKVDDFMIEASSTDISEEDFENFEQLQKRKVSEILHL